MLGTAVITLTTLAALSRFEPETGPAHPASLTDARRFLPALDFAPAVSLAAQSAAITQHMHDGPGRSPATGPTGPTLTNWTVF